MNRKLAKGLIYAALIIITVWVLANYDRIDFHPKTTHKEKENKKTPSSGTSVKREFNMMDVIVPEQVDDETIMLIGNSPGEKLVLEEVRKFWIGRIKEDFEPVFRILHKYIKEGDTVADIGCGAGYYTYYLSQLAGDKGSVFAIDTNPIAFLCQGIYRREMAKKYGEEKFRNITPLINDENSLFLGKDIIDVGYLSDVHILHVNMGEVVVEAGGKTRNIELENLEKMGVEKHQEHLLKIIDKNIKPFLKKVHDALKDGGIFIIAEDMTPPLDRTKLNKEKVIKLMENNGFKLEEDACFHDYHLLVFRKVGE